MKRFSIILFCMLLLSAASFAQTLTNAWTPLLTQDGRYFEKFIGIPHTSVAGLPDWNKGDGTTTGTPLGLNNDPLNVFKIEMTNGKPVLHVSGEIFGGYSTKQDFGNYHLKAEVKFGDKKYEPRLADKRDNGFLYHGQAPHGQFWHVWYRAQEFQVQEGDMGDYYSLAGTAMDIHAQKADTARRTRWMYDPAAPVHTFASTGAASTATIARSGGNVAHLAGNFENPHGEWTTVELYCFGDKSIHVINGHVVMVLENSRTVLPDGTTKPLTSGKIQFQSEGAEAYYRNIEIKKLDKLPDLNTFK
ncbi:DUF1080 domain-containing protein [Mucilaginibacter calamicampi]|uniref:DUF1080 domain-containing protein n=1 Tax=Mucilaginibacter calamicampi TaxID=1302352 RepID=A0ABW2YQW3_9SPHI